MFLYPTSIPIPFDILLKTPLTVINIYSKKTGKLLDLLVSLKLLLIIILLILFISGIEPNPGPKQGSLKIGCWNLNSILAREKVKINQIEALQSESKFHIFGICESWLSQSNLNSEIEIDGFSNDPFRSDNPSSDTHRRGGVCMYYDPNLPITNRKDLCLLQECIVAEIKLGQTKVFCILAYRSPNQSPDELRTFINKLESMFDKIQDENPSLIILLGDLNARSLQFWDQETSENVAGSKLSDFSNDYNLEQLINEPTHIPHDNIATCIDLILTNNKTALIDSGVIPSPDPCCKHQIIYCYADFNLPPPPKYKRTLWEYDKADSGGIKEKINTTNWDYVFSNKDSSMRAEILTQNLKIISKTYIPNKTVTINEKDSPWITDEVKTALRRNKRIYKNWVDRGRNQVDKPHVNEIQSETNRIIKTAKEKYMNNLGTKICDPQSGHKVFWSAYKRLANKKKTTNIPPLKVNDVFVSNFQQKANLFNTYFANQCKPLETPSSLPTFHPKCHHTLSNISINASKISLIIDKLNPKKAHGHDNISIRFLKICSKEISHPLKLIFEQCLREGTYPTIWKYANVQPTHKKNSRQLISNYRPISLLPILGKIFEKLIFDEMYVFFVNNNLLSKNQSGFRPGDSTINQLLSITNDIYEAFENHNEVRSIFLDISKAFDKVWFEGLIFKLKQNGINGNLLKLINNYLTNRKQRVVLNGITSEWLPLHSGVPQGSVLGPLLFLIYINDLTDNIESSMKLFADDSSLFLCVSKNQIIESHMQLLRDLDTIAKWADQWKMSFNPDITKQAIEVIFSSLYNKGDHPPLQYNDIPIKRQPDTQHLGVILDEKLTFQKHIKESIEKAKKGISLMKFLSKWVNRKVLEQTYKMYVRPHLEYGDILFHNQHKP